MESGCMCRQQFAFLETAFRADQQTDRHGRHGEVAQGAGTPRRTDEA
jgi:hypothetical protein